MRSKMRCGDRKGTHAGYKRHHRAGEAACDECRLACRDETRIRRANKEKVASTPATRAVLAEASKRWRNSNLVGRIYHDAKRRARENNLDFDLGREDVQIPAACPVLGIPIVHHQGSPKDGSPSLDRIDNTKGYVKGNVAVISMKANRIKNNASLEEVRLVLQYMERYHD